MSIVIIYFLEFIFNLIRRAQNKHSIGKQFTFISPDFKRQGENTGPELCK